MLNITCNDDIFGLYWNWSYLYDIELLGLFFTRNRWMMGRQCLCLIRAHFWKPLPVPGTLKATLLCPWVYSNDTCIFVCTYSCMLSSRIDPMQCSYWPWCWCDPMMFSDWLRRGCVLLCCDVDRWIWQMTYTIYSYILFRWNW